MNLYKLETMLESVGYIKFKVNFDLSAKLIVPILLVTHI